MNRDQAKEFYPIMQAFAEGKTIECRTKPSALSKSYQDMNDWTEIEDITYWNNIEYRIKPEPKYRPFKDIKECQNEMKKHQPFGWIESGGYWYNIISTGVTDVKIIDTKGAIATLCFSNLLSHYHFVDGTLLGIKVEE